MKTTESSLYVENKVGEWIEYWQQKYLIGRTAKEPMKQGIHITDSDGCSDCAGFWDNRPLTKEILKGLGFELVNDHLETVWKLNNPYIELHPNGDSYLFIHSCGTAVIIKTVGSVRMLIEALKGDE